MDVLDHHTDCLNNLDAGPELRDISPIPPEFIAGNRLTDALTAAEQKFGPQRVAELLDYFLHHEGGGIGHPVGRDGGRNRLHEHREGRPQHRGGQEIL